MRKTQKLANHKSFDPDVYLESLQLDILRHMEVDTSLYITNRARLEQMYPYLPRQKGMVADVVYSILKHAVSEEEARAVRDTSKHSCPNVYISVTCMLIFSVCAVWLTRILFFPSKRPFASWMEHSEGLLSHQVPQC